MCCTGTAWIANCAPAIASAAAVVALTLGGSTKSCSAWLGTEEARRRGCRATHAGARQGGWLLPRARAEVLLHLRSWAAGAACSLRRLRPSSWLVLLLPAHATVTPARHSTAQHSAARRGAAAHLQVARVFVQLVDVLAEIWVTQEQRHLQQQTQHRVAEGVG